eukprot:CCRYP_020361-RA/>CCRYP_020361-RA protein AED:0.17 eAED:0.02 QI:0/0/0/1/0/0/5/0/470
MTGGNPGDSCIRLSPSILYGYNVGNKLNTFIYLKPKHQMVQIFNVENDNMGNTPGTEGNTNVFSNLQYPRMRAKQIILACCTEDGTLDEIPPTDSMWWNLYIACTNLDDKGFLQKFCMRFHLPYPNFIGLFPCWSQKKCAGESASPLELLILGRLRYLGRGFTFDNCERAQLSWKSGITQQTVAEAKSHLCEFEMAGMSGCVASIDATHIVHENCIYRLNRLHKSGKSKETTRTINPCMMSNLSCMKRGMVKLTMYNIMVWFIVDNGCLSWAITGPPFIHTQSGKEIGWSEWLESMCKDVRCMFGILKGRWKILKCGIHLHGTNAVDCIWLTCCAFHNMLLEVDSLDQPWDGFTAPTSIWEGELGNLDMEDVPLLYFGNSFLLLQSKHTRFDTTIKKCHHPRSTFDEIINEMNKLFDTCVRQVHLLTMPFFHSRLVEHLDILWQPGQLLWPHSLEAKVQLYHEKQSTRFK